MDDVPVAAVEEDVVALDLVLGLVRVEVERMAVVGDRSVPSVRSVVASSELSTPGPATGSPVVSTEGHASQDGTALLHPFGGVTPWASGR